MVWPAGRLEPSDQVRVIYNSANPQHAYLDGHRNDVTIEYSLYAFLGGFTLFIGPLIMWLQRRKVRKATVARLQEI